ncbi:hypothetical protein H6P81_016604 [Aristolochia fimbriata]|uniref:Glutaredoxin domain-containing protein n=1 Tax=Aristolochia fimbriata TaxID=158543 RepID=A0AAV7E969_ARIFI|nr:hypothetical protein H6P81_016604 [Aristolochia fimbriata]
MKGMKGRILKKLKSIRTIAPPRNDRVLQVNAADGLLDSSSLPNPCHEVVHNQSASATVPLEPEIIDVAQLMRDLGEEDDAALTACGDKENIRPKTRNENLGTDMEACNFQKVTGLGSSFRRPDQNAGCLFDPGLLAAFQQVVLDNKLTHEPQTGSRYEPGGVLAEDYDDDDESSADPLSEFEERCPPGGIHSVILYTTTIRGIRKTFEDCNSIKFLLGSLKVLYHERDVSMHLEFREELWRIMGGRAVPPRLFIKGRYIGGADVVLGLHERGRLRLLVADIPLDRFGGTCDGCSGVRFVVCSECNGSHKLAAGEQESFVSCPHCNENGLVICPICS